MQLKSPRNIKLMTKLCFFGIVLLLMSSCSVKQSGKESLGEMEFYFDENLTCISKGKDGKIWVGSETGDVFLFNNGDRKHYDLQGSRIYKVIPADFGDSVLWVGMRNAGLQVWRVGRGKKEEKIRNYTIKKKGSSFSPYDFTAYRGKIFVCTSNGLYRTAEDLGSNELELIYPSEERLRSDMEFAVHNLCLTDSNSILASTIQGLLKYNIVTGKSRMMLEGREVSHVSIYNDTIFAISGNYVYLFAKYQDKPSDSIMTINVPQVYFRDPAGNHFLLDQQYVQVGKKLEDISVEINLRRTIPMESRNVILPDSTNSCTYILTENALWKIPNNMNIYHSGRIVKAACAGPDGDILYVTSKNELYRQEREKNKAFRLCRLSVNGNVKWIGSYKNDLYLCSSENVLYKMPATSGWFGQTRPEKIFRSPVNINTVFLNQRADHNPCLFIGTRKGLLRIDGKKIDTIMNLKNIYITDIFHNPTPDNDNLLYVSTLNDGAWYASGDKYTNFQKIPDMDIPFAKSIIASNKEALNQVIMLTNQYLLSQDSYSMIRAKGFQKLIYVNDSLFFALPPKGIDKFRIRNGLISQVASVFRDIRFEPNATLMVNEKLLLGSNLGAVLVDSNNPDNPVWIDFEDPIEHIKIFAMAVLILLFLSTGGYALWQRWTKNKEIKKARIQESRDSLKKRIEDLLTLISIFEPTEKESEEILKLAGQFEEMEKKKNLEQIFLDRLSIEIAFLNRRIGVSLISKIEEQAKELKQIACKEAAQLVKLSSELKETNRFDQIKAQFEKNAYWIEKRTEMITSLRSFREEILKYATVPDVTANLLSRIDSLLGEINEQALSISQQEFQLLSTDISQLESDQAKLKIIQHARGDLKNKVSTGMPGYEVICMVISKFEKFATTCTDNTSLLKELLPVEQQINIALTLNKIKEMYEAKIKILAENSKEKCNIANKINSLYEQLPEEEREFFLKNMDMSIHVQAAKILVILMTDRNVKRSHIGAILDISGNISPAVTKLIKKFVANEGFLFESLQASDRYSVFLKQLELSLFKENGQMRFKS